MRYFIYLNAPHRPLAKQTHFTFAFYILPSRVICDCLLWVITKIGCEIFKVHFNVTEEHFSCYLCHISQSVWPMAPFTHYGDVIMGAIASQITSLTIVYSAVYSDADQRKHQSSALLAFVRGIHRGPLNSPHKWPVTRKMFPFDDVIMLT